jgi:hypothetical protein
VKSRPIGFAVCPHATGRDEPNGVSWTLTPVVSKSTALVTIAFMSISISFVF